jgi:hypothetical protein
LEEGAFYAYGLKIAALSSKAFGGAPNNYQYPHMGRQGDYSEFELLSPESEALRE